MNTTSSIPPTNKNETQGIARPLANYHPTVWGEFHPTVWGEFFIHLLASENQIDHAQMQQRVEMLKEEVRTMFFMSSTAYDGRWVEEEMNLVDALQRLGLAYHFEEEISEALARIHGSQMMVASENLHVVSLRFRLLRQGAYEISSATKEKNQKGGVRDADRRNHLCPSTVHRRPPRLPAKVVALL
ncbi:hypothetical protein Taro_043434 [Colocasia esculenta]|uniref:Terpene synthase N-terminal domain-containing protein n=1 Tax=Colocasia esculenta TaxID=4460 RepID=A0A843WJG0_COLES|nr:hypothetical protein [Colocasia esculenta]